MLSMAIRTVEIWLDAEGLPSCVLSGKEGDAMRAMLGPDAKLIHTFEASNAIETMNYYYNFMGFGTYVSSHPELDCVPFQADPSASK
jgi:hypothetical protein